MIRADIKLMLLILLLGLFVFPVQGEVIFIDDSTKEVQNLNRYTFIAEDINRDWTIDSILLKDRFSDELITDNNIGFTQSGHWISFSVKNVTNEEIDYVLSLNMSVINEVRFFEVSNGKVTKQVFTGESFEIETRDIKHRRFAFEFSIPKGETKDFYLYVFNDGDSMYLPLALKENATYYEKDIYDSILIGVYFGIFLFIIIFNIFYIISLRELYYVYYTLYFLFATLFYMNIEGVAHILLPSGYPPFSDMFTVLFAGALHFCFLSFNTSFFKRSYGEVQFISYVDKVFKGVSIFVMVVSTFPVPVYLLSVYSVLILVPVVFSFLIITTLFLYIKKVESAGYFLIAYIIGGSGKTVYILRDFGVLPDNMLTEHAIQVTMIIESFIFFYAIMQRIRMNRVRSHAQLVEKNILLNKQQEDLHKVNEDLAKLSIVASETDNSVAIYDSRGNMEWSNDGFEKLFKHSLNLDGQSYNVLDIYPNEEIRELYHIAVSLKESVVFETLVQGRGDTRKWIYTTLTPILSDKNKIVKLVSIDSDITELKKTQTALERSRDKAEESNRLKTAFLSNVSHELRTPLNSIIGFSQLLLIKDFEAQKRVSFLKLINDNGNHLLNLISDIIDISKIESGHMQLQISKIDVNGLVNELFDQFSMQTKSSGKEFTILKTVSLPNDQSFMETDHVKLRQILLNLIGNSIKFTHKGHIHFGYNYQNGEIEFFVEDTGIGLTAEEINIVFHRFRQADDSITRKYGGTGLGLSISKGLIELLGGKLHVTSEKGKGTRIAFSFRLDKKDLKIQQSKDAMFAKSSKIAKKRILVVEDDQTNFSFLEEVLNENEAIVYHAENAEMAQNIFEEVELDMVLLDIQLPDINGYELAEIFRKQNQTIPIIAQTAYAYAEAKNRCLESGCTDYLSKPIEYKLLISKLEKYFNETT